MVTLASEEEDGEEEVTPQPSEDSDSGESYEASPEDSGVSAGDIEVAIQVVCTAKHSLAGASDVIKWDINSVIRNVKCMTQSV